MGWKLSDLAFFPLKAKGTGQSPQTKVDDPRGSPLVVETSCCSVSEELTIKLCWETLNKKRDRSSSGPLPDGSDPTIQTLEVLLQKGAYTLKVKKGIRKKDLFRFLLAKMLYEKEEGLHVDEFLILWELYLSLQDTLSKDPSFQKKYGEFFKNSFVFFQELASQKEFPVRLEENENLQYLERICQVLEPMLPSRSAYFGLKGQKNLRSAFSLTFESELLQRKIPEGRRIGVGYRDKGSRRDPAFDGSPDWREVALSRQEHRIQQVENFLGIPRESLSFDWDLVYNPSSLEGVNEDEENSFSYPED